MVHQHHLLNWQNNRTIVNLDPLFYHLVDSQYDQLGFPYQILFFHTILISHLSKTKHIYKKIKSSAMTKYLYNLLFIEYRVKIAIEHKDL